MLVNDVVTLGTVNVGFTPRDVTLIPPPDSLQYVTVHERSDGNCG